MLTLRAAAALLSQADSLPALRAVARVLGFDAPPLRLNTLVQRAIGIEALTERAEITRGPGTLRLLTAELAPHTGAATTTDVRELTRRLCTALAHHAPTRHWCTLTIDAQRQSLTIATVTPTPHGARIAALRIDRRRVVDSDAETVRALATVSERNDHLRHARFSDILRRDALSARFYRALEHAVNTLAQSATGSASSQERHELALLCASRCLFLAFLQAKGWLNADHDFLLKQTAARLELGGQLHERLLKPLFFGTLNTPIRQRAAAARAFGDIPFLNGGLFAPTPLEQKRRSLRFTDDALTGLVGDLLDRYRFTAHENSAAWSEAAVDPEMLGRAFECLMNGDERRRTGSFYTPPQLVEQVVQDALRCALPSLPAHALRQSDAPQHLTTTQRDELTNLRILDPACGSGAFLVHILERVADLMAKCGDPRPLHLIRRDILTRSIFGVDRNPVAVWLCELRLWLSVVIDCPETRAAHITPLPNLDHHIRIGDSLAGGDFRFAPPSARALTTLRERYTRATGRRKTALSVALNNEERARAVADTTRRLGAVTYQRAAVIETLRTRDLFGERRTRTRADSALLAELRTRRRELVHQRQRLELGGALPFRFAAHFADVAALSGFHIIIGNPPWIRPHAIPMGERQRLRREFRSLRHAAWTAGAKRAGAAAGFAGQADLAAAFLERSTQLLAPNGTVALLVPAKLWRALAGGGIRQLLSDCTQVDTIRDWSDAPALFNAATYPSLLVARRSAADTSPSAALTNPAATPAPSASRRLIHVSVTRQHATHNFAVPAHALSIGADPAAPWLLLPPHVRDAFERLRRAGPPLGDSPLGRPLLGVKSGCNAAFLVHATEHDDELASIIAEQRVAMIERRVLRPALRGDAIHDDRATAAANDLRIIWTHDANGAPLRALPPAATRWLSHWRQRLEARTDARTRMPWWTLFRTEAARCEAPRLVWADIGKRLRTQVLPAGDPTVPLNSCYVLRTPALEDALALNTLLSSPIVAAWLDTIAEPARGGFRRYLGWTVASLPLPPNWTHARSALADLSRHCASGITLPAHEHIAATADAYGVTVASMQPLLEWNTR